MIPTIWPEKQWFYISDIATLIMVNNNLSIYKVTCISPKSSNYCPVVKPRRDESEPGPQRLALMKRGN